MTFVNKTNGNLIEPKTPDLIILPSQYQWQDKHQIIRWLLGKGIESVSAERLVTLYQNIGCAQSVNWIWSLCQACRETGFLNFGGDVKADQNNFAGLGATGNGNPGESFPTEAHGVIAHLHHLALYAGLPIPEISLVSNRDRKLYEVLIGRAAGARFESLTGTWAADPEYYEGIRSLVIEAENYQVGQAPESPAAPPRTPQLFIQPDIDISRTSPNQSARGATIQRIVLHNTAGSFAGSVSWLCNSQARASAHLVISRDGVTAQLVPFERKAWHAGNGRINAESIGIELTATENARGFTPALQAKCLAWIRWLLQEYEIDPENIGIHRWYRNTSCPSLIWPTDDDFRTWRRIHFGV